MITVRAKNETFVVRTIDDVPNPLPAGLTSYDFINIMALLSYGARRAAEPWLPSTESACIAADRSPTMMHIEGCNIPHFILGVEPVIDELIDVFTTTYRQCAVWKTRFSELKFICVNAGPNAINVSTFVDSHQTRLSFEIYSGRFYLRFGDDVKTTSAVEYPAAEQQLMTLAEEYLMTEPVYQQHIYEKQLTEVREQAETARRRLTACLVRMRLVDPGEVLDTPRLLDRLEQHAVFMPGGEAEALLATHFNQNV